VTIDWRRVLIVELALLGACALLVVVWWIVGRFAHTILILLMAAVVAFAIGPLVDRVEVRLGGRRGLAAALVYLGLLVALIGGLALLFRPFVAQLTELLANLPTYAEMLQAQTPVIEERLRAAGLPIEAGELQSRAASLLATQGTMVLGGVLGVVTSLTNFVVDLALILVISFYLVLDSRRIRDAILTLTPARFRPHVLFVESTLTKIGGGYLRGQLLLAGIIGVLDALGVMLLGVPYPLIIGVIAAVTELIPMVGPVLGAIPAIALALLEPFPTVIWVVLYFTMVQQLENNLLVPRISGEAVGLHPLGAMLALMAGFEIAGILGGLFAVPLAGVLYVLVAELHRRIVYGDAPPPPPPKRQGWRFRRPRDDNPPVIPASPGAAGPAT
jgi:predicted PurR-regulated permease PerM